jgi:mannose/fructose/N-acetylgalactosamine-specific phosphotransferase system component IIC
MTIGCFGNRRFRKPGVTTGLPLSRLLVFLGFQARTISGFLTVRVSAATAYGFPDGREIKVAWVLKCCFSIYTRAMIALLAVRVYSGRFSPGLAAIPCVGRSEVRTREVRFRPPSRPCLLAHQPGLSTDL